MTYVKGFYMVTSLISWLLRNCEIKKGTYLVEKTPESLISSESSRTFTRISLIPAYAGMTRRAKV